MEVRDSVLTCKSLVQAGFSGERPIEPPGSWFLPKSSSEELKPTRFVWLAKAVPGQNFEKSRLFTAELHMNGDV